MQLMCKTGLFCTWFQISKARQTETHRKLLRLSPPPTQPRLISPIALRPTKAPVHFLPTAIFCSVQTSSYPYTFLSARLLSQRNSKPFSSANSLLSTTLFSNSHIAHRLSLIRYHNHSHLEASTSYPPSCHLLYTL